MSIDIHRDFYAEGVYNAGMERIKACAKVNLTLDVLGKRADGYHELSSVMLAVDIFDEIALEFDTRGIVIEAEPPLPLGSAAFLAAQKYCARGGVSGVRARIIRRIPPEAGLGGSSADAAAVLRALQAHCGALGGAELRALALEIGSDVPFLMEGGIALCEGRGEVITPLPPLPLNLLVVKPERGASTREVFRALAPPYAAGTTGGAVFAIRRSDRAALLPHIGNALLPAASSLVPEISSLLSRMKRAGALAASMTGSGSAVFGVFEDEAATLRAKAAFSDEPFAVSCSAFYNMV